MYIIKEELSNISEFTYLYSLSSSIAKIAGFKLTVGIIIPDDKNPVYIGTKRTDIGIAVNVNKDYPVFLQMRFPKQYDKDIPFKELNLTLNQVNKSVFCRHLRKFLKMYDRDDIFYLENGELKLYKNEETQITFKVGEKYVSFKPVIVSDIKGNTYEGGRICLDRESIFGDLTFSELCAMYDVLYNADLFLYSEVLQASIKEPFKKINPITKKKVEMNYFERGNTI